MSIGWVKLHRKALESTVWGHPIRWAVFSYLILSCNREPVLNKRYGYTVGAGECDHSIRRIADSVGADKDAVHRALAHLQSVGTVRRERRCKVRHAPDVVTLVNWALYNGNGDKCDTKGDTKANTECDTKGDILENKREAKKKESLFAPSGAEKKLPFEPWYQKYPRKKSKPNAVKAWNKLTVEQQQKAMDVVDAYRASRVHDIQHTPYPASYLNAHQFDDAIEAGDSIPSKQSSPQTLNGRGGVSTLIPDIED